MTTLRRLTMQITSLSLCLGFCESLAQGQEEKEEGRKATIEYTVKLEGPKKDEHVCTASISISYLQFDTRARVDSVLDNEECGASSGEYLVRLRIRDENGESKTIEYPETWAREDDAPVEAQNYYDIGANVDLRRVSTARLTCICAGAETAAEPE